MAIWNGNGEMYAEGCVVKTWEHNGYNDSDFYAEYLDPENGTRHTVEYDTTRFAGGGNAIVDLTPENYQKYWDNGGKDNELKASLDYAEFEATQVSMGKLVIVNRGRKVPHGVTGKVFWMKKVNYDPYNRPWGEEMRIGIRDDSDNVYWTYAKNVDVVKPENYVNKLEIEKTLENKFKEKLKMLQEGKRL